jgi:methylthioribose-1-phosphate isomerase
MEFNSAFKGLIFTAIETMVTRRKTVARKHTTVFSFEYQLLSTVFIREIQNMKLKRPSKIGKSSVLLAQQNKEAFTLCDAAHLLCNGLWTNISPSAS